MRGKSHSGFTLIEISIVLVIIGLIVGGVLLGNDLIESARIRSQISQLEKYKTATNTFFMKYGSVPGDMGPTKASAFGIFTARLYGNSPYSFKENGGVESFTWGCTSAAPATFIDGEITLFWDDLSKAQLIDGRFTGSDTGTFNASKLSTIRNTFPEAKIKSSNFILAYCSGNFDTYYEIYAMDSISGSMPWLDSVGAIMTATQASTIDAKVDDGMPLSGKMVATAGVGHPNDLVDSGYAGTWCIINGGGYVYDAGRTLGNNSYCGLRTQ